MTVSHDPQLLAFRQLNQQPHLPLVNKELVAQGAGYRKIVEFVNGFGVLTVHYRSGICAKRPRERNLSLSRRTAVRWLTSNFVGLSLRRILAISGPLEPVPYRRPPGLVIILDGGKLIGVYSSARTLLTAPSDSAA